MITVLAGGVGGARFLRGVLNAYGVEDVVTIVNVGDDLDHLGLRVCPDLDTITYWLADVVDPGQQWGRADERFTVAEELRRFGRDTWFTLGDRDLAVHLHRTERLRQGVPLSAVTTEIARGFNIEARLVPATDDVVATRIVTADGRDLHFQEYWVKERAEPPVASVYLDGADAAEPAPGVIEAILDADAILFAPSNPVVSIGMILAIPGVAEAIRQTPAPVVGVSPIVGGRVVRGMADRLLPAVGAEVSAVGVATYYGRLLDGWVVDRRDRGEVDAAEAAGIRAIATNTMMDDLEVAAGLARRCLELAEELA